MVNKRRHNARTFRGALRRARVYAALCLLFLLVKPTATMAQVDAEMVTIMGRNALSVDDYLTAIHYFNQAIESKPFLSAPYYYRAYAKLTLEDYTGAEADCDKSIQLNPFITEVYQLRGLCRVHTDNFVGAVADYNAVLREHADDQGARYNRALCFLQLNDYARADSDLTYMLQKWPTYYRTYMVKAQSLLEQKDTLGAMGWIDRLLQKTPRDASAWSFKGRYELSKGRYASADTCLTRAIALQPNDFELYISRAQARHAMDKFGLAIADYDRTIELQPDHFVAHYNRGLLRSFVGDLNRAIEDFDFVLKTEPDNTLARYNRAQLRGQVGNYRGAIADYTKLLQKYPDFLYGYEQRAVLRRKVGDKRGAANDESVVARRNLDLSFGTARKQSRKKVRLRSEHELDQYKQLVQDDPDTVRNVFGTLYGKVQNERTDQEPLPMFAPAFHNVYVRGYHSIGFMEEMNRYRHADTSYRQFGLTALNEGKNLENAESDERQAERVAKLCSATEQALFAASIYAARYNYTSALNEANRAVASDSSSVAALMLRASILMRSTAPGTLDSDQRKARLSLAQADLNHAAKLSPNNAYVTYNKGCLLAYLHAADEAIATFTRAIEQDYRLPEAYYNRALLYLQKGEKEMAFTDLSRAGQLGLYKAYALIKQNK